MVSPLSPEELEKELKDVGTRLLQPPSSTQDLLNLLDEAEHLLCQVEQGPSDSTHDALRPSMNALIRSELLWHYDTDVKVSVASCISEITRIMAPNTPYNDEEMKEFFQLSIVAVEQLSSTSGRSYSKAVSVLKTFANIRVCVLMLDLELDELIVRMFHQFLDVNSQSDDVLLGMEKIMTLVVEESEEPSFELLNLLLSSVKMENQNVSPHSWELGQKVLKSCADKLKPDLPKVVKSMGIAYHDYADIVASICQLTVTRDNVETKDPVSEDILVEEVSQAVDKQPRLAMDNDGVITKSPVTLVNEKSSEGYPERSVKSLSNSQRENIETAVEQEIQKKRGRKPNSLRKEEEGYDHTWITGVSSSPRVPCRGKNPKKKLCNLSKDSALAMPSPSDQGKELQSHVSSVKKVRGKILRLLPCENHSILEESQSGTHSGGPQANKIESSLNPESDPNLLSVSEGHLLQTQDGKKTLQRIPATSSKRSRSMSNSKGNHRGVLGDNASGSIKNGKEKRRRVRRKNVSECTRDAAEKHGMIHGENLNSTNTDGICSAQEIKEEFPVWIRDNMERKGDRNIPIGHATEKPVSEIGIDGASKVKRKRKSTTLLKKEDHGKELVGRKIKVWWPEDKEFYSGMITSFDRAKKKHMVQYTDGEREILYLGTERWELVEDAEDGEATADNKPGVIYSPKAFCGTQTDSYVPAITNYKTSSISTKKRTSSSCGKSKPEEADSGKRTKRRTLHDEKGKKSLAKILTVDQEPESTVKGCNTQIDVRGYKVKASNAPVLTAIFVKYGDIAANCLYKSASVRTFMLEVVCDIVKRLQSDTTAVIMSELQSIENEISDAEAAKLEVSWLREYLENLRGVEVGESSSLLKDMKVNTILVSKAAKRDLEQKQVELAAAQERVREAESCVRALTLVVKKISTDILVREAEEGAWRKPLNDLGKL